MGEPSGEGRHRSLTLVFAFPAFQKLANPRAVFDDARTWSRHVAVVGNDHDAVEAYLARHDLEQDLALGDDDKWLTLSGIRQATDTERHVMVGTTDDDRRAAEHTGWEYLPVTEAATKADWELAGHRRRRGGFMDRLRQWLPGR